MDWVVKEGFLVEAASRVRWLRSKDSFVCRGRGVGSVTGGNGNMWDSAATWRPPKPAGARGGQEGPHQARGPHGLQRVPCWGLPCVPHAHAFLGLCA